MDHDPAAIPIDAHPDPVLGYTVSDGTPTVTATNEAFETRFGGVPTGDPVAAVLDRFGLAESPATDDPLAPLRESRPAAVTLSEAGEDATHLTRVVPADDGGFLVFTPLDDALADAGPTRVGQVASVVSHDLRNPLDVATAHLRAARETGDPEHFDAVAAAHDRMERITRDVLTLARGDDAVDPSAGVSVERAAVDAWQSVETDRAALEVLDALPTVTADRDRLRRVFENLFRNAVEHAGEAVTVRVGALDDGFYVADDGPGVPPDERAAVFDPGHSTGDGGTGLGLAIVERVVAAHGWDLRLTSARGGGARFEVRFS